MPSLQDQLKQAGLIDAKKAKQVQKQQRKQKNQARRTGEVLNDSKQHAQAARAEKAQRDRALNLEREDKAQQKAIAAQIKQLITTHRQAKLAQGQEEVEYNFTDAKHIKKIRVSTQIQQQIIRGQLAIVRLDDSYELVPRVVADKIALRDANALVVANSKAGDEPDEDDPYKDYVIPDDLMW